MRAIFLDCFSGISGNMLLGAFIEAGVPATWLQAELNKLPIKHEFDFKVTKVLKNGIAASYVTTELEATNHHHHHHHRTLNDIKNIVMAAAYSDDVKSKAVAIFENIAVAEGKVHGKAPTEVTFHEVGAVDSIVDIVGIALCLEYLNIAKILVGRINLGGGVVKCAHGIMPVPAPAVAELLKNWSCYQNGNNELTTPTGAGFVTTLGSYSDWLSSDFSVQTIAYGAGSHDNELANVLRLYLGEFTTTDDDFVTVITTNIDDMNPQIYGYLTEKLLAAGALDIWTTPIFMKKNRPAQELSVMVKDNNYTTCSNIIFQETTAIGLRVSRVKRLIASRKIVAVNTVYGKINCKVSGWQNKIVTVTPEYEDCRKLALQTGRPLKAIQLAAKQSYYATYAKAID